MVKRSRDREERKTDREIETIREICSIALLSFTLVKERYTSISTPFPTNLHPVFELTLIGQLMTRGPLLPSNYCTKKLT